MAFRTYLCLSAAFGALLAMSGVASAESLQEAMASAYANNPTLNAARAGTRAADEYVPQALAGYRPTINGQVSAGVSASDSYGQIARTSSWASSYTDTGSLNAKITIIQPIYTGGRVANGVNKAESSVKAAREALRSVEQSILQAATTSYMSVIVTGQILELRQSNVAFLREQVRAANDRFTVGEGTRTDVSQAEAALASATASVSAAQADHQSAIASYVQIVGHQPKGLRDPGPIQRLVPSVLSVAVDSSRTEHPDIRAAIYNSDTAAFNVSIEEGALLPTFSLQGSVGNTFASMTSSSSSYFDKSRTLDATVMGVLSIPIYQGGAEYSAVRQAKEQLGQAKLQVDAARAKVDAELASAWSALESAKAQIIAARASVSSSQLALDGVIEEQKVGQRTTLDVLTAQSTLISAKLAEVSAQYQLVVASYGVVGAMGHLDREHLDLKIASYKPEQHYQQVRDKWIGLRTPDGR